MSQQGVTVVATGVFGILHPGHVLFLREAKKLGDKLIVIVARDRNVEKKKGRALIPEEQRLEVVKALSVVDEAILGDEKDTLEPIAEIRPDIVALGKDQDVDENSLRKGLDGLGLEKTKIARIESYWTSELDSTKKIVERIKKLS